MAPMSVADKPIDHAAGRERLADGEGPEAEEGLNRECDTERRPTPKEQGETSEDGDDQQQHEGDESAAAADEASTWTKPSKQTLTTDEITAFLRSRCQQKLCSGGSCNMNKPMSGFSSLQWSKNREPRICLACEGISKGDDNGAQSEKRPLPPAQKSPASKKQKSPTTTSMKQKSVEVVNDGEEAPSKFMFGVIPRNNDFIANNEQPSTSKPNSAQRKRSPRKRSRSNNKQNALIGDDASDDDEDYEILPEEVARNKNGETPFGKIRSCMCSNPSLCREILWRWARLQEGKYISYVNLPHTLNPQTPVGKHILAYREAFMRKLGYTAEGGEGQVERILRKGGGRSKQIFMSTTMNSEERLAIIHFHPALHPYILQERDTKCSKVNKWRIPIDVGRKIKLKEEDKCPTKDSNDATTYFAVPTYDIKDAEADVKRAERQFRQKVREQREQNLHYRQQMKDNPDRVVVELHEMKVQNDNLRKENQELKDHIQRELLKQNDIEKKCQKLRKGMEKMARRLDKYESGNSTIRRRPKDCAKAIYKDVTGMNLSEEGYADVAPNPLTAGAAIAGSSQKSGSGGKRWSDPRMDKAVQARLDDPKISTEEALRLGGFEFPEIESSYMAPNSKAVSQRDILDADNVSMTQRKNNLLRRLRRVKKMAREANAGGDTEGEDGEADEDDNAERKKQNSDPRMDKAVQAKLDNPNLSSEEALSIGGYEYPEKKKGVSQKDIVDAEGISLTQRKNNLGRRLRRIEMKKQRNAAASQEEVAEEIKDQNGLEAEYEEEVDEMEEATVDDLV